ncbi:mfs multidrug transporter [Neofusicoccum parvum]|uniref:Mfs multidrug transporter n=2 Tax=Neofusicoccum parvum TaxID=310453 RepID=A0ACB5RPV1_9PEZI|nr:putative mfs multidrug transporter protein [Neofusicoccum parvum UCRNP2]GME22543.1 mfs multidrug transporter [Neofusicoccum parvum]GME46822.1 mfs multidrug transporter [Neofusicoccum parvum]
MGAAFPEQSDVVELAAEEGHDADIPTNLGAYTDPGKRAASTKKSDLAASDFNKDVDLEKSEGSTPTSINERDEDEQSAREPVDPNIVDWDGPNDPENPMNWPKAKKWLAISIVSLITFLIPLGSSIFAPGVPELMAEFNSTDELLSGFVVSVYVLGFAVGPLIIAPLSEMYGRMPLYHTCNVFFIIFNVACALSTNLGMLIAFRFLAGCVGASPLTLGGGTIADLIPREQRGTAMAIWVAGPCIGPVVGPLSGGFLSQAAGWRWTFWVVSIASGVVTVAGMIFMSETYAIAILNKKVKRLRKETGNMALRSKLDVGLSTRDLFFFSIVRPTKMLFRSPIVFLLSLYVAVAYAYLYILFTTFTLIYKEQYGFNSGLAGLTYLGVGLGSVLGQWVYTVWGNRSVRAALAKGHFTPEHRLPLMFPGAIAMPIGLFWYGWSVEKHTHWIVPIIGTVFIGFGLMLIFMAPNTYLVDVYTLHAASAMAANTVMRSIFGAFVPLAGQPMYKALGLGWGNSLLGFVAIALIPIPIFFVKYGEKLRAKFPVKL